MADIDIEQKAPSVWPWVVGLLVLALLVWALVEMFDAEGDPTVTDTLADTASTNVIDSMDVPPP